MSVTAYVGVPGSGKSYEVVTEVIMPAIGKGRRVITNVHGIRFDRIAKELISRGTCTVDQLGSLMIIENEDIERFGQFWITEARNEEFRKLSEQEMRERFRTSRVMEPGDLLVIDEAWRWIQNKPKDSDGGRAVFEAFRFHRHCVNPLTGVSADIVLVTQSMADIHRDFKVTIERHFTMRKLKALGLNSAYTVRITEGYRGGDAKTDRILKRRYNPKFFQLYESYSHKGQSQEKATDRRVSIFSGVMPKVLGVGVVGMLVWGVWGTWRYFHPEAPAAADKSAGKGGVVPPGARPLAQSPSQALVVPAAPPPVKIADQWRLVGYLTMSGGPIHVLQNDAGRMRYVYDAPQYRALALDGSVGITEGFVTPWSAGRPVGGPAGFPGLPGFGGDPRAVAAAGGAAPPRPGPAPAGVVPPLGAMQSSGGGAR